MHAKLSAHKTDRHVTLKPIFHRKTEPNANEIDINKNEMYMYMQSENFALGTQRNLYSTDPRWGFATRWGFETLIFHDGGKANFSVFRYQHVGIANASFCVGGLTQRENLCWQYKHVLRWPKKQ